MGKTGKSSTLFLFLCSGSDKTNFDAFLKAFTCLIFLFFCISAIVDQLNQLVKSKRHLVNKNHSFFTSGTGASSLLNT